MLVFHVQGSASRPYKITADGAGDDLAMFCTCPAGSRGGMFCKHSAALLMGVVGGLRDPSDDVDELKRRAEGSHLLLRALDHRPADKRQSLDVVDLEEVYALARNALPVSLFEVMLEGAAGADDRSVAVHTRFANGKPRRKPALALRFSRLTYADFDEDGVPLPRRPSTRPWLVAMPGKTRSFAYLGGAAAAFSEEIGRLHR